MTATQLAAAQRQAAMGSSRLASISDQTDSLYRDIDIGTADPASAASAIKGWKAAIATVQAATDRSIAKLKTANSVIAFGSHELRSNDGGSVQLCLPGKKDSCVTLYPNNAAAAAAAVRDIPESDKVATVLSAASQMQPAYMLTPSPTAQLATTVPSPAPLPLQYSSAMPDFRPAPAPSPSVAPIRVIQPRPGAQTAPAMGAPDFKTSQAPAPQEPFEQRSFGDGERGKWPHPGRLLVVGGRFGGADLYAWCMRPKAECDCGVCKIMQIFKNTVEKSWFFQR
jgi:hypothetical protein